MRSAYLTTRAEDGADREGSSRPVEELRNQVEQDFKAHRIEVYFYLLMTGAQPPDADELMQETFVRLYQHLRAGKTVEKMRPWLFRVARNLLLDRKKGTRWESTVGEEEWLRWHETLADPKVDIEKAALTEQRRTQLHRALRQLTPLQVQYLHLRTEGLRYREIAEIYGVALSTVVDTIRRAVERLGREVE